MSEQDDATDTEAASYDVAAIERKWQQVWADLEPFRADDDSPRGEALRADDVPVPER